MNNGYKNYKLLLYKGCLLCISAILILIVNESLASRYPNLKLFLIFVPFFAMGLTLYSAKLFYEYLDQKSLHKSLKSIELTKNDKL